MADFRNMLGSDEDSNEDNFLIDHIPKTPGPPVISSDRDSDEEKSGDEKEEEVKNNDNDSDSDSDSSSSPSDSSNDNNRNSRNDSEVERSDNENEDNEVIEQNKEIPKTNDTNEVIDEDVDMSSDDNEDNEDKTVKESHDNEEEEDSDDDVVKRRSPKKKRQLEDNSDSSDDESNRNKKQRTESNDNEDNDESDKNEDKDEEMADKSAKATDIFGEMSSEDEDDDEIKQKDKHKDDERDSDKESIADNRDNERRDEESGDEERVNREGEHQFIEDEPQEEPIPETRIEVEIPRIVADLGSEVHFVKLPNFLSVDTHPYDPQWYEDEIDEDENLDEEGRARLKLKVENTIRWRNVIDRETNDLKKESNTRVVKWSDGTFSLHLGEEIFDIHKHQLLTGDNNHLFIRQGTGLQGQTVFRTKLNFRPFSTESFTHRKLTLSLADRSQKTQKIRVLPNVGKDPEAHRTEMIKKEEDRLKASIRRENKQRRVRERSLIRGPTASYLEPDGDEDDEEEGISIARIKNQYKRGSFNKSYDDPELSAEESKQADDDDDEEEGIFAAKSKNQNKRTSNNKLNVDSEPSEESN